MLRQPRLGVASMALGSVVLIAGVTAVALVLRSQRSDQPTRGVIGAGTVVMLGDSITQEADWSELFPDHDVANRGYSGFTTAELVPVAEDVARAGPAAIFVLTGTNDIRDDRPPSWTIDHLNQILDRFERIAPASEVVIQTVLPRSDARSKVTATNEAILALAFERELSVLDLHAVFDDGSGGLRTAETYDGVHLSDAGYEVWAGVLTSELVSLGVAAR